MAKKNKAERRFGQLPLPSGHRTYRTAKLNWIGLNKRQTVNSGELSYEENMSTAEYPYMVPCERREEITKLTDTGTHLGLYAFGDVLISLWKADKSVYMKYNKLKESGEVDYSLDGVVGTDYEEDMLTANRCVVQFNQYDNNANILDAKYTRKLIILPDKKTVNLDIEEYDSEGNLDTGKVYRGGEGGVYQWDEYKDEFTIRTQFTCFDLTVYDPVAYYNDGYVKCKDDDHAVLGTDYYERVNAEKPYEYRLVKGLTVSSEDENGNTGDGASVSKYYVYDDDLGPAGEAAEDVDVKTLDKDKYYFNTYNSMIYHVDDSDDWKLSSICSFPDINYAVVHQSRLFGVGEDRIYVSGFNDYANWNYDTINESYAGNAWTTTAQANTKAGGRFTGISVFDNHVCCFKSDFMHEVYNSQNPFRLVDIGAIGTIDNRSIQEVNGRLIFVAEDGVKMYTGSTPREIGTNLGIDRFTEAIAGSDGRNYYLSCKGDGSKYLFVYDTEVGAWSEQSCEVDKNRDFLAAGFAKADSGMYMLTDDGKLYKLDTGEHNSVEWSFETDLTTGTTSSTGRMSVDIKHIRKIQFLAEVGENAKFKVYILCDGEELNANDKWQLAYASTSTGMIPVRIKPRKTAHYGYKLRFEGSGYVKIHELEVHIRQGGELYESE